MHPADRRADQELWVEVGELLRGRPGWSIQAMSAPGAPPVWCFGSGGEADVSVSVDGRSINLYVMQTDLEVDLAGASELEAWLRAHRPEALQERKGNRMAEKLKRGTLFHWE